MINNWGKLDLETLDLEKLTEIIGHALGPDLIRTEYCYGELTAFVYTGSIVRTLSILKNHPDCRFKVLVDICGVDYPEEEQRFQVVYHLLSLYHNLRLRVKILTDAQGAVPSVTQVYPCANWYEREVWDLYGIPFADHPDLRRILTDYNFDGHPLRKDFPLTGFVEARYDETEKRVAYEPVKLRQEFRNFDFLSPWEGLMRQPGESKTLLQGQDEKVSA